MSARAVRAPDGATLIQPLHVMRTWRERTRGLLDQDALPEGEGVWFPRCRLIHTFGMQFTIDVVYLNAERAVCKVVEGLRPGRLSACLTAQSVIELKSGSAKRLGLTRGVRLRIEEH